MFPEFNILSTIIFLRRFYVFCMVAYGIRSATYRKSERMKYELTALQAWEKFVYQKVLSIVVDT